MDWLIFPGIVLGGLIFLVGLMLTLRMERMPRRMPIWLAVVLMVLSGSLLVISLIGQYWLAAAGFALNFLLWGPHFASARRAGAS